MQDSLIGLVVSSLSRSLLGARAVSVWGGREANARFLGPQRGGDAS